MKIISLPTICILKIVEIIICITSFEFFQQVRYGNVNHRKIGLQACLFETYLSMLIKQDAASAQQGHNQAIAAVHICST